MPAYASAPIRRATHCSAGNQKCLSMLLRGQLFRQCLACVAPDICRCDMHQLASYISWHNLGRRSATEFFEAGFASTGHGDEVVCTSCGLKLAQWPSGMRPLAAHRALQSGHCEFVSCSSPQGCTTDRVHDKRSRTKEEPVGNQLLTNCLTQRYEELLHQLPPSAALLGRQLTSTSDAIEAGCSLPIRSVHQQQEQQQQHLDQQPDEEATKQELHRLRTFTKWEYSTVVDPRELARAGFYYAGPGDRVQCAYCRGMLRNWERGDQAMALHAEHFTYCRFVQGHDVGNVPIAFSTLKLHSSKDRDANFQEDVPDERLGISCSMPKHADMAVETRRLATFATWSPTHSLKPDALAKAGFFYIGRDESVECFYCDGTISEWPLAARAADVTCDPWVEHAKRFPTCPYVEHIKGREFVQQHQNLAPSSPAASQQTGFRVDPREIRARVDSPKARILIQMDYPLDLLREVIQKRLATTGDDHASSEALLADAFMMHDDKQQALNEAAHRTGAGVRQQAVRLPIVTSSSGKIVAGNPAAAAVDAAAAPPPPPPPRAPAAGTNPDARAWGEQFNAPDVDLPSLSPKHQWLHNATSHQSLMPTQNPEITTGNVIHPEEKNHQLKTQLTCKICMDALVGVVFLPCGHFVCCPECSPALTICPICRVSIRGTVRTYL